jgi:hypothetical protein
MPVYKWSKTAASNATADSTISWAEGQAPSTVNDSSRAEMAAVAMWRDDISGTITTGGSSTAYTVTTNSVFSTAALMSGAMITFIPHTTSGAAPTLAVDGLTARAINIATSVAVPTGALVAGTPYVVTYIHASTEFILMGRLAALPATTFTGAITGTSAALSAGLTVGTTLAVTGVSSFSDDLRAADGDATTPSYGFTNDTDCGWYRIGANNLGLALNGAKVLDVATTGLTVTGTLTSSGALSAASFTGNAVATQADQETGTSTTTAVSPGRQHFHQSAAKLWLKCDHSGNLASPSYNITSVTDTGAGVVTVTIATDFSDADYAVNVTVGTAVGVCVPNTSQAVGSFVINAYNTGTGAAQDSILGYYAVAFGDFA